ncbi:Methylmalonyl-CoA epimerase [Trichinella spiralis]|uniref:Methylmalonyl-CoA epimerase n=2 Tax=Trichinella TaxID=6333 RepID=A0ABR3KAM8_TRISP
MSLWRIGGLMKRDDFRYLKKFSTSAVAFADDAFSLGKLNHVAIACPDLKKAADFYKNILGAEVSEPVNLPNHGVTTVFVNLGNSKIELLHPLGDKSPISGYLKKNTLGGMHHICVEVDNIEKAIANVKSKGIKCLAEKASIGAHGKPVMFLHPKDCNGVLIELEQATVRNDDIMLIHKLHQLEKEIFMKKQNIRENLLKRNMEYSEFRLHHVSRLIQFSKVQNGNFVLKSCC